MSNSKHTIVIIGANFAGLSAAKQLSRTDEVILIDPNPWFEFFPNIHELVSEIKSPEDLRLDRGKIIEDMGHTWKQDRVTQLDGANNRVTTSDGTVFEYDACIFAIGGVNDFHGVKGAEEFAFPFKSVQECKDIGNRYKALRRSGESFSIVIVGGGSEGVEGLGELLRAYKKTENRTHTDTHFHLVEGADRLLPAQHPKASKEILNQSKKLPVTYHLGQRITEVLEDKVKLTNGKYLEADLTIWTGGVRPHPLIQEAGLTNEDGKWASVRKTLQSTSYDNIFVTGDAADLPGPDSKQAYFAMETGELAGKNALLHLHGHRLHKYSPIERPALYSFGELTCLFIYSDLVVSGKPISLLKEAIYQKTMADFQGVYACDDLTQLSDRFTKGFFTSPGSIISSLFSTLDSPLDFFTPAIRIL